MKNPLMLTTWSPYVVGAGIGILSWVTFAWMGKALGTSTTMARTAGVLTGLVAPDHVYGNAYYQKYLGTAAEPKAWFEWQFALVIMMIIGALVAAKLARSTFVEHVPELWTWRFGPSKWKRYLVAFVGGIVLLFGARLAGGCTSGHGISGGMQLAVSSWVFFLAMFASGVVTAFLMFGAKGRSHV
ncbi:MAG: YeeE/YedE family protein [Phycisphaerales bacterium]|nr:YeeE/YedE family protein [Phycisphaerales bacterium]